MTTTGCLAAAAIAIAAVAAYKDARTGLIPNWLTLGTLATAPLLWLVVVAAKSGVSAGFHAAGTSAIGALVCGVGPAIIFWRGGLGGGDVKLLAATGALLGPGVGLDAEFLAFLVAALWVPGRLAFEGKLGRVLFGVARAALNPFRSREQRTAPPAELRMSLRFGPAILAGAILAVAARGLA